jgi:serine/threonine protein kinase
MEKAPWVGGHAAFIQMDLCDGDLHTYIQEYMRLWGCSIAFPEYINILSDVVEGIEFLHSHGVIHRDIKPKNCYSKQEKTNCQVLRRMSGRWVLCDFGFSQKYTPGANQQSSKCRGTLNYCAPELLRKHDEKVDIWALGCLAYYLAKGEDCLEVPRLAIVSFFAELTDDNLPRVHSNQPLSESQNTSQELYFVNELLHYTMRLDPSQRLSARDLRCVLQDMQERRSSLTQHNISQEGNADFSVHFMDPKTAFAKRTSTT